MLPDVHELELDNGFRALLVERHNLPVVGTTMWYRVGGRDELSGESGLSHFIEHMMFKGTVRYAKGEIDRLTSRMGGSNNAFTDHDNTCYHFSLPSERWETALEIESSRMRGCLFVPDEFDAEKSVVLEELAMGLDDPWQSLFQHAESLAFQRHPYHRPIIGWEEELRDVSVDRMREFYRRHYGTNRGFLVVCGAIDRARTEDRIAELFGSKPLAQPRPSVIEEPKQQGERRGVVFAPGNLPRIAFACRTCRIGEPDDLGLDVVAQILGHGKSSRLHRRLLLDDQIATYVGVQNDVRLDPGLFWVYAELHAGVDPARGEAAIRDEVERLVVDGVTQEELERAITQIRASFLHEDETVLGTALKIGRFESSTEAGYKLLDTVEADYEEVSAERVRETAARYFAQDGWSAVWSLPESQRGAFKFARGAGQERDESQPPKPSKRRRAKSKPVDESVAAEKRVAKKSTKKSAKKSSARGKRSRAVSKKPRPTAVRLDRRRHS